jgi:hypothetical protein
MTKELPKGTPNRVTVQKILYLKTVHGTEAFYEKVVDALIGKRPLEVLDAMSDIIDAQEALADVRGVKLVRTLPEIVICPVCGPGLEAEVSYYIIRKDTGERIGFHCRCGSVIINGQYMYTDLIGKGHMHGGL